MTIKIGSRVRVGDVIGNVTGVFRERGIERLMVKTANGMKRPRVEDAIPYRRRQRETNR